MADNDFNREILYPLERPICDDLNQAATYVDQEVRDMLGTVARTRSRTGTDFARSLPTQGFYGNAFKVYPNQAGADGNVYLTAGTGLQYLPGSTPTSINGVVGLDDPSAFKPLVLTPSAVESSSGIPVPAAPGGVNGRVDIIEVRANMIVTGPLSRDVLQPVTGVFSPQILNKTLQWILDNTYSIVGPSDVSTTAAIKYKTGTVGAPASSTDPTGLTVPSTTPGYIKISEVFVYGTSTTFGAGVIKDTRQMLFPSGQFDVSFNVQLSYDGANSLATVFNPCAPPGVVIGCYGSSADTVNVYLITGQQFGIDLFIGNMQAVMVASSPAQAAIPQISTNLNLDVLSDASRAALASSSTANPNIDFATKQPIVNAQLRAIKSNIASPTALTLGAGDSWQMSVLMTLQRS